MILLLQVLGQCLLRFWVQPLLHNVADPAAVAVVGILEILSNPGLDVWDLWEGVTRRLLACVELRETNAEADLVYICVGNDVVSGNRNRWVDQKLDQTLRGKGPTLGIAIDKRLRVSERLGERYDSRLAVGRTRQLLGFGKDDGQVHGFEDTVVALAHARNHI
jgi:hypothetical protein